MKSSGPVERLLRALGRRDSSRATSRVGVPANWAEEGPGVEVWAVGGGDQDLAQIGFQFRLPQPSALAQHPLITQAPRWPGLGRQQHVSLDQSRTCDDCFGSSLTFPAPTQANLRVLAPEPAVGYASLQGLNRDILESPAP